MSPRMLPCPLARPSILGPFFVAINALVPAAALLTEGLRYIIISSPTEARIYYAPLPTSSTFARDAERQAAVPSVLIDGNTTTVCAGLGCIDGADSQALDSPGALAVYEGPAGMPSAAATLYVADTGAQRIYAYGLQRSRLGTLAAGVRRTVREDVQARGMAVDSFGTLFFTNAGTGQVESLTTEALAPVLRGSVLAKDAAPASVLYSGHPGAAGIAADGFSLYWAEGGGATGGGADGGGLNGATDGAAADGAPTAGPGGGSQPQVDDAAGAGVVALAGVGADPITDAIGGQEAATQAPQGSPAAAPAAVVRAPEAPAPPGGAAGGEPAREPTPIAANGDLYEAVAKNLCLARDTVFYTGGAGALFAVKAGGGTIAEVANGFSATLAGCAYDLKGTLFVADAGAGVVYSLPANFATLRPFNQTKEAFRGVTSPTGIAVLGASAAPASMLRSGHHPGDAKTTRPGRGVETTALVLAFLSSAVG